MHYLDHVHVERCCPTLTGNADKDNGHVRNLSTIFCLGGALNPARALGPSIVFVCNWNTTWVYVLAELAGGAVAGVASFPLYGRGKAICLFELQLRTFLSGQW